MNFHKITKEVLSISLLVATVWISSAVGQDDNKFTQGQPVKGFDVIQENVFCDSNNGTANQCSRMNKNYLKFYFSVFITIAWGCAVRTVIKTFELSIPYTVVLLITGLILGLGSRVNQEFCETWSMFTRFARTPPELILYIFLPILIFESAFSMKAHVFMRSFLSIVVVALPGMLITTFVTAIGSRQFMNNYGWTFSQASLFGAIISATDPVAVVAILRELGTSEMLSVMIEGESLLNDGVAILLYEIFKEVVETPDNEEDTLKIAWQFVRIAIGGPTFGVLMGKVTIYFLSLIFNDAATEITITLVSAYLTYFIGEFYLSVSGVMAVVILGVTMSADETCISPEVEHVVHQFWEMMSFLANTVLFVLLGIVISETAINSFEIRDGYNVIWLYLALNIIRLMMLLILSPLLSRVGYGITWRNLTVMMWGGLRGAVAICLALEVYKNKKLCKFSNIGPKFLLQTAGIVILTLLINGTTTKSLLDHLGVTKLSIGKLQDMANAVRTITSARVRTITALKHDRFLADANWEVVHRFTHLKDPYAKKHKAHDEKARKLLEQKLQRTQGSMTAFLNEKLITGGHLSQAKLTDMKDDPLDASGGKDLPVINTASVESTYVIHHGTIKPSNSGMRHHPSVNDDLTLDLISSAGSFKAIMEESRLRVLKAMKISCWRQYERGALSEEAVKLIIGDIEQKEDMLLCMIHVADLREHWSVKGFFPWLQTQIDGFIHEVDPPKPKTRCRHPIYWLTIQPWFHGVIYFIIFLNLGPIILESVLIAKNIEPTAWQETFLFACTLSFTGLYLLEFLLKIVGRGFKDYFSSKWNLLDFFVLCVSLVEVVVLLSDEYFQTEILTLNNTKNQVAIIKNIRLIRFVRLMRWFRPLLPLLNRFLEIRINVRLFMGYDVGKGYIQALEDALRFLPQMIDDKNIIRKFKLVLDEDRIQTVKELGLLQLQHPGVVVAVKTRHASRSICNHMTEDLENLTIDGLLDEKEFDLLTSTIEGNLKKLWASPPSVKAIPTEHMIGNISWVVGNNLIQNYFRSNFELLKLNAGDVVYEIGDCPNGIHMVSSGLLKLQFEPTEAMVANRVERGIIPNTEFFLDLNFATTALDYLGCGAIIGELGVLTKASRDASIKCETDVELYHWPKEVMENAMEMFNNEYDSLEARLWRSFGIKLAAEFLHTQSEYMSWTGDKIRAHLEQGIVPVGEKFSVIEVPEVISDIILIYGQLMNHLSSEVLQAPAFVPATWNKIGPKEKSGIGSKILMIAHEEGLEELIEKGSLTSLHKCIVHGPGVAVNYDTDDEELDPLAKQSSRQRKRSVIVQNMAVITGRKTLVIPEVVPPTPPQVESQTNVLPPHLAKKKRPSVRRKSLVPK